MSAGTLALFAGVVMVAYVIPGPDWVVILRHSARSRRAGLVAAAGVQCGLPGLPGRARIVEVLARR
ncbi:hypothetical protein ACFWMR_02940 [Amycolatopsis thailandensis]|uniref:hypothetical protein n=1 Tax=Amycolatopsis thailandensis TaxID=589330 RepID=UPI0036668456